MYIVPKTIFIIGYRTLPQKSSVFTPLFQNNAIALMIQRGCFFHDGSTAVTKSSDIQFEDSSSYSQSFSKSNEIDVEVSILLLLSVLLLYLLSYNYYYIIFVISYPFIRINTSRRTLSIVP